MQIITPNPGPLQTELLRNAAAMDQGAIRARILANVEEERGDLDAAGRHRILAGNFEGLGRLLRRAALALREGDPTSAAHFLLCEKCSQALEIRRTSFDERRRRLTSWFHRCACEASSR